MANESCIRDVELDCRVEYPVAYAYTDTSISLGPLIKFELNFCFALFIYRKVLCMSKIKYYFMTLYAMHLLIFKSIYSYHGYGTFMRANSFKTDFNVFSHLIESQTNDNLLLQCHSKQVNYVKKIEYMTSANMIIKIIKRTHVFGDG